MADRNSKAYHAFGLFILVMLMQRADATEFRVGGTNGWTVPTDPKALSFNQWAEMNRFRIGDTLLFVYLPEKDSVLRVEKDDYVNCNTAKYLALFNDGNTSFKLNQSGPYYFISGISDNCNKNEKLAVVVMADRGKTNQTIPASPPSPPTEITPSVAPSGQESPSPPSSSPNRNGASSKVVGAMGSFWGFSTRVSSTLCFVTWVMFDW
ncbi:hypothetical protein AAC387_Pa07g2195 [Persea americana]